MSSKFLVILLSSVMVLSSCENPYDLIEKDKARFDSIANTRPVNSSCYKQDTASIKLRGSHPLNPTGGWTGIPSINYDRTKSIETTTIHRNGSNLTGFVRFASKGYLQLRSYDDLYGSVYCGWSPQKIHYKPTTTGVHLSLDRCSVGDGGLSQVTEVCWFPENKPQGVIVYSSAHLQSNSQQLELHETYLEEQIGTLTEASGKKTYYFRPFAIKIFNSLLSAGKVGELNVLLETTLLNLKYQRDAINGTTRKPIPATKYNSPIWVSVLLFKSGLNVFNSDSIQLLKKVSLVAKNGEPYCRCEYINNNLSLFLWLANRLQGKEEPLPEVTSTGVHGRNPFVTAKILRNPEINEKTKPYGSSRIFYFWFGVREYLAENYSEAKRYLNHYQSNSIYRQKQEFETSVAAVLLDKMAAED